MKMSLSQWKTYSSQTTRRCSDSNQWFKNSRMLSSTVMTAMVKQWLWPNLEVGELAEGLEVVKLLAAVKIAPLLDEVVQPPLNVKQNLSTRPVLVILTMQSPPKSHSRSVEELNLSRRVKPQMEIPEACAANWIRTVEQPSKRTRIIMVGAKLQRLMLFLKKKFKL